jgi:hypothetical protein
MGDFSKRFLAMMLTGVLLVFILPLLAEVLFSVGPIGFVVLIFAFCFAGSVWGK